MWLTMTTWHEKLDENLRKDSDTWVATNFQQDHLYTKI